MTPITWAYVVGTAGQIVLSHVSLEELVDLDADVAAHEGSVWIRGHVPKDSDAARALIATYLLLYGRKHFK